MKIKTVEVVEYPRGWLCLEDKVAMMQKIQQMQLLAKEENLGSYPSPKYSELLEALTVEAIADVKDWRKEE